MSRCGEVLTDLIGRFRSAGVAQARLDARLLLAHALDVKAGWIFTHPEHPLTADQEAAIERLAVRRIAREPVSRIVGRREFWGLAFSLSPATLDPRPDSETVVEAILAQRPARDRPLRILDWGTGSGCLLLALLSEYRRAQGVGLDADGDALAMARSNAEALGLAERSRFEAADWHQPPIPPHDGGGAVFDVIVANPPYIEVGVLSGLAPEVVLFDPILALSGGADGLTAYRALAPLIRAALAVDGIAAVEVGVGQAAAVVRIFADVGLSVVEIRRDLGGIERCVVVTGDRPTGSGALGETL
jgi:release factor glutamine methyltransferase